MCVTHSYFTLEETVGVASAADAFVTLAGAFPRLWVGGPVFPPGLLQIQTVIYANWQARACGSPVIPAITGTTCEEEPTEAEDAAGRTACVTAPREMLSLDKTASGVMMNHGSLRKTKVLGLL